MSVTIQKDSYIVIGGNGFLGRHIVEAFVKRGDVVSVLDIVQRYHDVPFYSCDISVQSQVEDAFRKVSVAHTSKCIAPNDDFIRVVRLASFILHHHLMDSTLRFTGRSM